MGESSYIDGLMQERYNSSALAMELHLFYIMQSIDGLMQKICNSSAIALELHIFLHEAVNSYHF